MKSREVRHEDGAENNFFFFFLFTKGLLYGCTSGKRRSNSIVDGENNLCARSISAEGDS